MRDGWAGRSVATAAGGQAGRVMSVAAYLFDIENIFFDGTCWHRWVHQQAVSLGSTASFPQFLGTWQRHWLPRIYQGELEYWPALEEFLRGQTLTECQVLELVISARSRQRDVIRNSRPLPGIQSCLNLLKRNGKKLGVICNSVHTSQELLQRLVQIGLHIPLDNCLTSRSAGRNLPDSAALLELVSGLGGAPEKTAYVSTSSERLAVARGLGMPTVQIAPPDSGCGEPSEFPPREVRVARAAMPLSFADFRVTDIRDLHSIVERDSPRSEMAV